MCFIFVYSFLFDPFGLCWLYETKRQLGIIHHHCPFSVLANISNLSPHSSFSSSPCIYKVHTINHARCALIYRISLPFFDNCSNLCSSPVQRDGHTYLSIPPVSVHYVSGSRARMNANKRSIERKNSYRLSLGDSLLLLLLIFSLSL